MNWFMLVPVAAGALLGVIGTMATTWIGHRREQATLDRREWGAVPAGVFRGAIRDVVSELASNKQALHEARATGGSLRAGELSLGRFEARREELAAGLGNPEWQAVERTYRALARLDRLAPPSSSRATESHGGAIGEIDKASGLCSIAMEHLRDSEARLKSRASVVNLHRVGSQPPRPARPRRRS